MKRRRKVIDGRKVGYGMVWYGLKRERSGRNLRGGGSDMEDEIWSEGFQGRTREGGKEVSVDMGRVKCSVRGGGTDKRGRVSV